MKIRAEAHSDDGVSKVSFDAVKWFEVASDQEVLKLAKISWEHGYEADYVAQFFSESETKELFDHLSTNPRMPFTEDTVGFECSVNEEDACRWLAANRPDLYANVTEEALD